MLSSTKYLRTIGLALMTIRNILKSIEKKLPMLDTKMKVGGREIMVKNIIDVKTVADYFLSLAEEEAGDGISNLKLQKLLYYAQGFTLAATDMPLFDNAIEAWQHGPVVAEIYHKYSMFGSSNISMPIGIDLTSISENADIKEMLNEVYNVYGQFSAWKLRDMTHEERPWRETYYSHENIIAQDLMKDFFKTLLV